jgi:hypothetical protein
LFKAVLWIQNDLVRIRILIFSSFQIRILPFKSGQWPKTNWTIVKKFAKIYRFLDNKGQIWIRYNYSGSNLAYKFRIRIHNTGLKQVITILILAKLRSPFSVKFGVPSSMKVRSDR